MQLYQETVKLLKSMDDNSLAMHAIHILPQLGIPYPTTWAGDTTALGAKIRNLLYTQPRFGAFSDRIYTQAQIPTDPLYMVVALARLACLSIFLGEKDSPSCSCESPSCGKATPSTPSPPTTTASAPTASASPASTPPANG